MPTLPREGSRPTLDSIVRTFVFGVLALLLAGIVYELTLALRSQAATDAQGTTAQDSPLIAVELFVLLGASLVLMTAGAATRVREALMAVPAFAFLSVAAVGFVVARDLTYDLSAGREQRFVETGRVSPLWLLGLGIVALVAVMVVRSGARAGVLVTATVLWISALCALLVQAGH